MKIVEQPSHSNAFARFDTEENAIAAEKNFNEWVNLANKGDYNVSIIARKDNIIVYVVYAKKHKNNCSWQCNNIRSFWITQSGLEEVNQDTYALTQEDAVHWLKAE